MDDNEKIKSNDVVFNILAFVPIVNIVLSGMFGTVLIVNDKTLDSVVRGVKACDNDE